MELQKVEFHADIVMFHRVPDEPAGLAELKSKVAQMWLQDQARSMDPTSVGSAGGI